MKETEAPFELLPRQLRPEDGVWRQTITII
jgi:hypothetical protein